MLIPIEDFEFLPNVTIYSDGSCKNIRWKALAVPSAAAYQKGPDGKHRYAAVQVPIFQPQSAVAAEFLGLHMAIRLLPDVGAPEAVIAADCQAVVTAFKNSKKHDGHRSKYAGLFREANMARLGNVIKVRAHPPEQEATETGQLDHWYGNDTADHWAKDALNTMGKGLSRMLKRLKRMLGKSLRWPAM